MRSDTCSANLTVAPTIDPVPTCDSLSMSPRTGTTRVTRSFSCGSTNATGHVVNCGNGTSFDSQTGTCNYVNNSSAIQQFTATCNVSNADHPGTYTSSACRQTITVYPTEVVPEPRCEQLTVADNSGESPHSTPVTCE